MTIEEYRLSLQELEENYEKQKKQLAFEYAKSNNPYKIGDIVESNYCIMRIERIEYEQTLLYGCPACCYYYGKQLTKQLKPKRYQHPKFFMSQFAVLKKIN